MNKPDKPGKPPQRERNLYLHTIELMLLAIDKRMPDDSFAPKPYEVSATEMRDLMRLARGQQPLTREGRRAMQAAREA
jgi:hypothetical protein